MNTRRTDQAGPRPTGLESTLVKVYQNKRLRLPLESTLIKNRGRGGALISLSFHRRPAPASPRVRTPSPPQLPLSPFPAISCALLNSLAALFRAPALCFQCFAHSFPKTPGGCGSPQLGRPTTIPKTGTARRRASWHGCRPRMAYWSWVAEAICLAAGLGLRRSPAIILSSAGTKYPTTIPMAPAGRALPEVLS